jgi:hypothetical protein
MMVRPMGLLLLLPLQEGLDATPVPQTPGHLVGPAAVIDALVP